MRNLIGRLVDWELEKTDKSRKIETSNCCTVGLNKLFRTYNYMVSSIEQTPEHKHLYVFACSIIVFVVDLYGKLKKRNKNRKYSNFIMLIPWAPFKGRPSLITLARLCWHNGKRIGSR